MRVLQVASGREWRGGQRQTWLLARGLARSGTAVRLLTRRDSELARRAHADGVPTIPTTWNAGLDPRALVSIVAAAGDSDLLHAHDGHAVSLAALASLLRSRPLVVTRRLARPLANPRPWRRAAHVIAISGAVRDHVVASGIPAGRITVIHPAIDLEATRRTIPLAWGQVGVPDGVPVLVSVAALTREKGMDVFLEAVAKSGGSGAPHAVIVGAGPERAALDALSAALGVRERVHFMGQVADPLPMIAAAEALVMPSREEGFGSTILDALALGVPVLASGVGGVSDALACGGGVMVPPGDPAALATEIRTLLSNPARRGALASEAKAAAGTFDLAGMVEQTTSVYRKVLEGVERQ